MNTVQSSPVSSTAAASVLSLVTPESAQNRSQPSFDKYTSSSEANNTSSSNNKNDHSFSSLVDSPKPATTTTNRSETSAKDKSSDNTTSKTSSDNKQQDKQDKDEKKADSDQSNASDTVNLTKLAAIILGQTSSQPNNTGAQTAKETTENEPQVVLANSLFLDSKKSASSQNDIATSPEPLIPVSASDNANAPATINKNDAFAELLALSDAQKATTQNTDTAYDAKIAASALQLTAVKVTSAEATTPAEVKSVATNLQSTNEQVAVNANIAQTQPVTDSSNASSNDDSAIAQNQSQQQATNSVSSAQIATTATEASKATEVTVSKDAATNNKLATTSESATSKLQTTTKEQEQLSALTAIDAARANSADANRLFVNASHRAEDKLDDILGSTKQNEKSNTDLSANLNSVDVTNGSTRHTPAPDAPSFSKFLSPASSHAPVAEQVLVQIRSAANQGANQIKIQLHPEDMGKVVVQLNTDSSGKTGISITADNRQTLALLQNEAKSLETALRNIGINSDGSGLNFNLSGDQQQNPKNWGQQGGYTYVASTTEDSTDYTITASLNILPYASQQGVDIHV